MSVDSASIPPADAPITTIDEAAVSGVVIVTSPSARRDVVLFVHQQDGAADLPAARVEWRHGDFAGNRLPSPVRGVDDVLAEVALPADACPDGRAQPIDRKPDVEVEEVLSLHFVAAEAPQVLGAVVPREHMQL